MIDLNYPAIVAATIVVFLVSSVYYVLFAKQLAECPAWADSSRPPAWKIAQEPVRTLLTALVLAGLSNLLDIADVAGAVGLALALWMGFLVVLLAGSVIHESVPLEACGGSCRRLADEAPRYRRHRQDLALGVRADAHAVADGRQSSRSWRSGVAR